MLEFMDGVIDFWPDDFLEISSVVFLTSIVLCFLIALKVSWRKPLYYNLFVVEMHTYARRRMVQVLHLGQEYFTNISWDRLVQRVRDHTAIEEERISISDTNIVIQSPNTVIDSPAPARSPVVDSMTLWQMEMPPPIPGQAPDSARDSQFAAAAAIAILARGDDASLRSQVFNHLMDADGENVLPPSQPNRNVIRPEFVTTDVTYTSPAALTTTQEPTSYSRFTVEEENTNNSIPIEEGEEISDDQLSDYTDNEESDVIITSHPLDDDIEDEAAGPSETIEEEVADKALIRLKFMNDTERETFVALSDTIAQYKVKNFDDPSTTVIRLIYQGQLLRDDSRTLESYGLKSGSVLHCHISSVPYTSPPSQMSSTTRRPQYTPLVAGNNLPSEPLPTSAPPTDTPRPREERERFWSLVFMIVLGLLPILNVFGFRLFRVDGRGRQVIRPSLFWLVYQWMFNYLLNNGGQQFEEALHRNRQNPNQPFGLQVPASILWVFGGQVIAVGVFFYFFPHLVDTTAVSIFVIIVLYFVFVVWNSRQSQQNVEDRLDGMRILQL